MKTKIFILLFILAFYFPCFSQGIIATDGITVTNNFVEGNINLYFLPNDGNFLTSPNHTFQSPPSQIAFVPFEINDVSIFVEYFNVPQGTTYLQQFKDINPNEDYSLYIDKNNLFHLQTIPEPSNLEFIFLIISIGFIIKYKCRNIS